MEKDYSPVFWNDQIISLDDDDELKEMEEEIDFLEEELVQGEARFPNNVTMVNYLDYLLVPSLVYWMEYPRTNR